MTPDIDLCSSTSCPDRHTCERHRLYLKWRERGRNTAYVLTECVGKSLYTPARQ